MNESCLNPKFYVLSSPYFPISYQIHPLWFWYCLKLLRLSSILLPWFERDYMVKILKRTTSVFWQMFHVLHLFFYQTAFLILSLVFGLAGRLIFYYNLPNARVVIAYSIHYLTNSQKSTRDLSNIAHQCNNNILLIKFYIMV